MSAVFAPPRLRGPGLAWVPAVLRRRATWRTVWRFAWAGPLIGGLPYVWTLVSIPLAYVIGVVPAALAGLLFAAWYHGHAARVPSWPWRAGIGALAGLGASALIGMATAPFNRSFDAFWMAVWALHGVPAGAVLGVMQRRHEGAFWLAPSRPARSQRRTPLGPADGSNRSSRRVRRQTAELRMADQPEFPSAPRTTAARRPLAPHHASLRP